ncbi:hypothetical protein WK60_08675 [Burkholderia ubonensis]|nr:hypothetical protein [Burkholderia ubonensis]KVT96598.1 hypothetical protein WK60_08675 [Burkholderia ubonensis]
MAALQADTKAIEENYGPDSLKLVVIKSYLVSLLDNARLVRWLAQFRPDYLKQLQTIAEVKTLIPVKTRVTRPPDVPLSESRRSTTTLSALNFRASSSRN